MTEKIEVAYKPVAGMEGAYHKYLIYTDSQGVEHYASAFPENYTFGEQLLNGGFGELTTTSGVYRDDKSVHDWDPSLGDNPDPKATPHPRETLKEGDSLSEQWKGIQGSWKDLKNETISYDPFSSNSNAAIDEALRENGLPLPTLDGPEQYWSPGSDYDLPGGEVPSEVSKEKYWQDMRDTLREKTGIDDFQKAMDDFQKEVIDKWEEFKRDYEEAWGDIKDLWSHAKHWQPPRDPLILDLDGDGLETVGLASNVYFDHDNDGVLSKTGWVGQDDALLVWDRNSNGSIDSGAELFGDFTVLPNGTLAPNGFAALAALDSNSDDILDANDPAFAELKLWRDVAQQGQTGSGELISLADAGIVSLSLTNSLKNQNLANGNQLTREGSFTRADGTTSGMGEFCLAIDTLRFKPGVALADVRESRCWQGATGGAHDPMWRAVA